MKIKQKTKQKFDEKLQKYFLFVKKLLMNDPHHHIYLNVICNHF